MSKHIIDGLMRWVEHDEWSEGFGDHFSVHLGPACMDAGVEPDDLPDMLGETYFDIIWGVVFEDFAAYSDENGRNLIDDYLKRRGFMNTLATKQYLRALRHSHMSLYEISDVLRDTGFMARDMLGGGEPVLIHEKSGTHTLKQWDILAARIVIVQGRTQMCGGCLLFDRPTANRLMDMLGEIIEAKQSRMVEILPDMGFVFTNAWLADVLDRLLNKPELVNSEGDPIQIVTVCYPLARGVKKSEIAGILDSTDELRRTGNSLWDWLTHDTGGNGSGNPDAVRLTSTTEDGMTVLGQIELKGRNLILQGNSNNRVARGRDLLETILEARLDAPEIAMQDFNDIGGPPGEDLQLPLEDQQIILRRYLDGHYRKPSTHRFPC